MATFFLVFTAAACLYLLFNVVNGRILTEVRESPWTYVGIIVFCAAGLVVRIDRLASDVAQPKDMAFAVMLGFVVLVLSGAFVWSRLGRR